MFPKKVKFRKWQTDRVNPHKARVETRGTKLSFGSHGLKSLGTARIKSNQIESARKTMTRLTKKTGKIWIRIFPDRPYTAKAAEVGMGKGKGDPQGYVFTVRPGRMLFEIDGLTASESKDALRKAGAKLPVKTTIVSRAE